MKEDIELAPILAVIGRCANLVVYLFPMTHATPGAAVAGIQFRDCVSDITSKCGVGLATHQISNAKDDLKK